jgi:hypothetical protein
VGALKANDKGNVTVVLSTADCKQKIAALLEDQAYRQVVFQFPPASYINPSFSQADCGVYYLLHVDFLLALFLGPDDGDNMFLQNSG